MSFFFKKNSLRLFFGAREKILINFKSRLFQIKNLDKIPTCKPTQNLATEPTKHSKSKLKLQQEFINEIIADKKEIISSNSFRFQNPSFLAKDLIRTKQNQNEQLVNNINDGLII